MKKLLFILLVSIMVVGCFPKGEKAEQPVSDTQLATAYLIGGGTFNVVGEIKYTGNYIEFTTDGGRVIKWKGDCLLTTSPFTRNQSINQKK